MSAATQNSKMFLSENRYAFNKSSGVQVPLSDGYGKFFVPDHFSEEYLEKYAHPNGWPDSMYDVQFGQPNGRDFYTKLYFATSKAQFQNFSRQGLYPTIPVNMRIVELSLENQPPEEFLGRIARGGKEFDWDKREHFQSLEAIDKLIKYRGSHLFLCLVDGVEVAYAFFRTTENFDRDGRINKEKVTEFFRSKHNLANEGTSTELYKISTYPEYRKKGYGTIFAASTFSIMFNKYGHDIGVLDSRDNNPSYVPYYYKNLGFDAFYAERLPSDVLEEDDSRLLNENFQDKVRWVAPNLPQREDIIFEYNQHSEYLNSTRKKPLFVYTEYPPPEKSGPSPTTLDAA